MWKEMVAYFNLKTELTNSLLRELIYVFKSIFLIQYSTYQQLYCTKTRNTGSSSSIMSNTEIHSTSASYKNTKNVEGNTVTQHFCLQLGLVYL